MLALILLLCAPADGRPLHYWGARAPAIVVPAQAQAAPSDEAKVLEVHAAPEEQGLILKLSFDRSVREALRLSDGTPVSGRLRAVLYLDVDDDRRTGWDVGPLDLRTGADERLEIGVLTVGADPGEKRASQAVITARLAALTRDGRLKTLWQADDAAAPANVSAHGDAVEIRFPPRSTPLAPRARLVLAAGTEAWDGRIGPAR